MSVIQSQLAQIPMLRRRLQDVERERDEYRAHLERIVNGVPCSKDRYGYTCSTDPYREARKALNRH